MVENGSRRSKGRRSIRWLPFVALAVVVLSIVPGAGAEQRCYCITGPDPVSVCPGTVATFDVVASGEGPLTYQWFYESTPLVDGGDISGADGPHLSIEDVEAADAGHYSVQVSGPFGSVTSCSATLSVKTPTRITSEPETVDACPGETVVFSVTAVGEGALVYQWTRDGVVLSDGGRISGTSGSSLRIDSVQATDAGMYAVDVIGSCGSAQSSATLLVKAPTTIEDAPDDVSVCPGGSVYFAVTASGEGALTYQWYRGQDALSDNGRISGAATDQLTIEEVTSEDSGDYLVEVTGVCGTATSLAAQLSVKAATAIAEAPTSVAVVAGENASFSVDATGEPPLAYQWFRGSTPLSDGGRVSGTTTDRLTITGTEEGDTGAYSVTVSGDCGSVSASTNLTVRPAIGSLEIVRDQADLLIVLDLSSSMEEEVEGGVKITLAKDALRELIAALPQDTAVGLRTFHRCERSDLEVAIQPISEGGILHVLYGIDTYGTTPLAYTLQQIPGDFAGIERPHVILFITDGMETCDGDPVAEAAALSAAGLDCIFKLVGFDVAGQGGRVRAQLQAIAAAAGGSFTEVASGNEFVAAVNGLILPPTYQVSAADGTLVTEGTVGDGAFELVVGEYNVTIDTQPQRQYDVVIESDGAVTLTIPLE